MRMREGVPCHGELLEESAGDGDVHPCALGVEWPDGRSGRGRSRRGCCGRDLRRRNFIRLKLEVCPRGHRRHWRGGAAKGGHEEALGRVLDGPDGRGDECRVPSGLPVEAGQEVGRVLGRDHLGELVHGREAEIAIPKRLLDLRVSLDQLRCDLPVLRRTVGEPELPRQEGEEAGVPELRPPPLLVEPRKGDQEVTEGPVLAAEESGETGRVFACSGHEGIVARVFEASVNARGSRPTRERDRPSRTPHANRDRARRERRGIQTARRARCPPRKRSTRVNRSTTQLGMRHVTYHARPVNTAARAASAAPRRTIPARLSRSGRSRSRPPVSYTHLTLPTILLV